MLEKQYIKLNILFNELQSFNMNIIILISVFSILFLLNNFTNIFKKNSFISIIFNLPGTIFHELAHFLVGLITLAKPVNFSLIPKFSKEGITLGSVSFTNLNFFNSLPIALAPYLLLIFSLQLFIIFGTMIINYEESLTNFMWISFYGFIIYSTLNSSSPSSQDWKIAFQNKFGLIFYLVITIVFLNEKISYLLDIIKNQ